MKLQNKKTGEIRNFIINRDKIRTSDSINCWEYSLLSKLNEEWKDCEDQEERKYDGLHIAIMKIAEFMQNEPDGNKVDLQDCVNVLRKLEALKRLKYAGFEFKDFYRLNDWNFAIRATSDERWDKIYSDLNLLFGGND